MALRRTLLAMKREQEEALFQLERDYAALVHERRAALISFLRAQANSKGAADEPLRQQYEQVQCELRAFLKVRVCDGWQEAMVVQQMRQLKTLGLPGALLDGREQEVAYLRALMAHLLQCTS